MNANYDYNANKDFLKEVSLEGDLMDGKGDDLSVSYQVTHDFSSKNTNVRLMANTQGTNLAAEFDRNDGSPANDMPGQNDTMSASFRKGSAYAA